MTREEMKAIGMTEVQITAVLGPEKAPEPPKEPVKVYIATAGFIIQNNGSRQVISNATVSKIPAKGFTKDDLVGIVPVRERAGVYKYEVTEKKLLIGKDTAELNIQLAAHWKSALKSGTSVYNAVIYYNVCDESVEDESEGDLD